MAVTIKIQSDSKIIITIDGITNKR